MHKSRTARKNGTPSRGNKARRENKEESKPANDWRYARKTRHARHTQALVNYPGAVRVWLANPARGRGRVVPLE